MEHKRQGRKRRRHPPWSCLLACAAGILFLAAPKGIVYGAGAIRSEPEAVVIGRDEVEGRKQTEQGGTGGSGAGSRSNGSAGSSAGSQSSGSGAGSQSSQSAGGSTGSQSAGNAGGSTGGQSAGNAGGSTGSQSAGNAGGSAGGQSAGSAGGSTGGQSAGSAGGSAGGQSAGSAGGSTGSQSGTNAADAGTAEGDQSGTNAADAENHPQEAEAPEGHGDAGMEGDPSGKAAEIQGSVVIRTVPGREDPLDQTSIGSTPDNLSANGLTQGQIQKPIQEQTQEQSQNQNQNQNQEQIQEYSGKQSNKASENKQQKQGSKAEGERRLWLIGLLVIYGMSFLLWLLIFRSKGGKEKMKELWKKIAGSLMLAMLLMAQSPLAASAQGNAADADSCEAEKAYRHAEVADGKESLPLWQDLLALDWENISDEELQSVLDGSDMERVGAWLSTLTEEEMDRLMKRDTILNRETSTVICHTDSVAGELLLRPEGEAYQGTYADNALRLFEESTRTLGATYYPAHKSGYFTYKFVLGGQVAVYRVTLSGLSTSVSTSTQQKVSVSTTLASGTAIPGVNFYTYAGKYNTTSASAYTQTSLQRKPGYESTANADYLIFRNQWGFTKPAGYAAKLTYEKGQSWGSAYYKNYNGRTYDTSARVEYTTNTDTTSAVSVDLVSFTHIFYNTTVGAVSTAGNITGQAMCYQVTLTPAAFTTVFDGNGATGGSVASQSNVYGQTYTLPANGFARQYTVDFNGNGGSAAQASATASYAFQGWGFNQNTAVTHLPGQSYSSYTTVNGAVGAFYAIWEAPVITLPSAERTGYTFKGWGTSAADMGGAPAGSTCTPTSNMTLYATWEANPYTIVYNDGVTENARYAQSMTYGTGAVLAGAEELGIARPGYTFQGWKAGGKSYREGQMVLNLTAENGGIFEMTAVWEANTDTPYQVEHYLETEAGSGEYALADTEQLTGTTGSGVTPEPKDYEQYETPEKVTAVIEGDGSTVVRYYYAHVVPVVVTYRVEHYVQNASDPKTYDLDEERSQYYQVSAGSSVTPDVITAYDGYEIPNPQTVQVADDGSTVIKYYYKLKGADGGTGGSSGQAADGSAGKGGANGASSLNEGNQGDGDINHFKAGDTKYFTATDGTKYEIYVNPDGTLTIRSMSSSASASASARENVTIAGTLTINNTKYKVTQIAPYAFKNNKTIRTVTIGNGITMLGKGAFEGCTKLRQVKFGVGLSTIGARAFYGCTALETVKTTKTLTTIGSKAFYNCKKLKSYTIGKYVKSIGSQAFYNCRSLKKITISESVERIEKQAFYKCAGLKSVNIKSMKLIKIGSGAFKKCKKSLKFTVPAKKKKAYTKLLKGKI